VIEISPLITSFPTSTTVSEGSRNVGLTKTVLEVKGNVRGRSYIPELGFVCWALLD